MRKICSLILALVLLISAIPISFAVSAADDNVYCYIANKSSLDTVYNNMQYTSDDYSSVNEALDAAFEAFANAPISGSGTYRICLAKDIVLTEPLSPQPSVKKGTHFHLNGHSITYNPTGEYMDTSAITISSTYFNNISLYGTATEGGPDTLINNGTAYFFSTTLSGDNFKVYGSYKGEFTATKMRTYMITEKPTFYGNVTSNDFSANTSTYIKGDLYAGAFWSASGTEVTVTGDYTCNGRTYPTATLNVGGNFYGNMTFGNAVTFKVNPTSNITVGGDAVLNSKTGGNLFDTSANTPGKIVFGGTVTLTGAPTSIVFKNTTFKKGIINNTTNNAKIVLDTSDSIGSVFYVDNEIYQISETVFGGQVTPPADPIKDGYTFIGWENSDGVLVDFANEIQGENSAYYARFSLFTDTTFTATEENNKLPECNLVTADNEKILCFKDSNGNFVKCGSVGTVGETYTAVTVKFNQVVGAQIRIFSAEGTNGIRFLSNISKSGLDSLEAQGFSIVEMGTKIAPYEYFSDSEIAYDSYIYAIAGGFLKTTDTEYTLAGSIVDIKGQNLNRDFMGQGYLKIQLPTGDIATVTATIEDNKRSVYTVAGRAYNDKGKYTSEMLKAIKELYLDSVVIINKGMIETPEGYATPYIYTGTRIIPNTDLTDTTANIRLAVIEGEKYYTDSEDRPIAAVVTDTPDAGDITALTAITFNVEYNNSFGSGTDKAGLLLPKTYTENGTPTRLIITCHGHNDNSTNLVNGRKAYANYFAHQGYAVLMVDGGAAGSYNMGNAASVGSVIGAYNYVKQYYNIYDEVFLRGNSMGGLSSMSVACSGEIPILAEVQDSPVLSLYRQGYCYGWTSENVKWVSSFYKFSYDKFNELHSTDYTNTTFPFTLKEKTISDDERELYQLNFVDKIVPICPIWKYCSQFYDYDNGQFKEGYEDYLSATDDARIAEIYDTTVIDYPVPLKIYHATKDGTVPYKYSEYFYNSCNRSTSGAKVELKTYSTSQHCSLGDDVKVYCKDGSTMTVKDSFVDMLNYFKSFEQCA